MSDHNYHSHLDTSRCPDPNDICQRDSNSGEILYCAYHYKQIAEDVGFRQTSSPLTWLFTWGGYLVILALFLFWIIGCSGQANADEPPIPGVEWPCATLAWDETGRCQTEEEINPPVLPEEVPPPTTVVVTRGEPIYLGETPAGDCVSGTTQWTFEPCEMPVETTTTTTTIVAVGLPPVPQAETHVQTSVVHIPLPADEPVNLSDSALLLISRFVQLFW